MYKRCVFEEYGLFETHRFGEDLELVERIFFYNLNKEFGEKYNGHTFLSEHSSVPNIFTKIEMPLYISPDMDESNLTSQYEKNRKEIKLIHQTFRNKHWSGELDQFLKLEVESKQHLSSAIKYNTLEMGSFVMLPEIEYKMILSQVEKAKEMEEIYTPTEDILNSLSWKITAPIRWVLNKIQDLIQIFK